MEYVAERLTRKNHPLGHCCCLGASHRNVLDHHSMVLGTEPIAKEALQSGFSFVTSFLFFLSREVMLIELL
jgi:hypothetical protein